MRVVHIHKFGASGGSGGAASLRRLNGSLRRFGIESQILCVSRVPESEGIVSCPPSALEARLNALTGRLTSDAGLEDVLNVNHWRILRSPAYRQADIVQFHRIPKVFSYLGLPALTRDKPGVLTPGEMWFMTGHCRHSFDCTRWQTGCGKCPRMDGPPPIKRDGTALQWRLKRWAYEHSNLAVVANSRWLLNMLPKSLLADHPGYFIPNPVDTDLYRPLDKRAARRELGLPAGKHVLMCAAVDLTRYFKGMDLLIGALKRLPRKLRDSTVLLMMGRRGEVLRKSLDIEVMDLGFVEDESLKATAYSAADLFAVPSRAELFGNVVAESLACATPAVGFSVGNIPDLVVHGRTGLLAKPEDPANLARCLERLLDSPAERSEMGSEGRELVLKRCSEASVVERYVRLYTQRLSSAGREALISPHRPAH